MRIIQEPYFRNPAFCCLKINNVGPVLAKFLTRSVFLVRTDNDRSELLKEAEPIDYTGHGLDGSRASNEQQFIPGLYQSDPVSRPQFLAGNQGFGSTTVRPTRPPPRNIFDDV